VRALDLGRWTDMKARGRVLVVEDNPANQLLARVVLERDGFTVDIAESVASALQSLTDHRPDLILMDIQLAEEDGLALTRQLRAQPAIASIPVVALTAHAMAGNREEAIAAGCDGYITKPIDTRTFAGQVNRFLNAGQEVEVESTSRHTQEASRP
jgi:CheY-like chemotaxis protein